MTDLGSLLAAGGGFAPASALRAAGIDRTTLERALSAGDVVRVRRGWYALAGVPEIELAAVRAGGVLTCVSLLHALGLWTTERPGLHITLGDSSVHSVRPGAVGHWRRWPGQGRRSFSQDGIGSAILNLITCIGEDDAIVTIDSALNSGLLDADELPALRALAPAGKRNLFARVDGRSQSGLETKTRLSMRRRNVLVRPQVLIPRVGRVDEVIGDRMVLETDGYRYHSSVEQFHEDPRRDLELARQEYLCIRLDNHQIMDDWPRTEAALFTMIGRNEHLWTAAQRRRRGLERG
ncbi:type IV toxin-antitoxin system AbiEi family antitoxin domain-containing protein [Rathayibacter sp. VKM Ac-2856]|uniref:type IV toxin-antitoxin system AbiEi family antitoxin domain-containing protein n=1 Tax=unclassified Rathayibacter TaxID=2609250 RepID=UPI001566430A|nr:type IV toxin-antitoxin system AbiEi family antitoxin domain-containing protein [Rathayibacter sp. VKM Ac-2858]NQX20467.1 type IV toxin-antitoxin system AbiEi family antitoxin domain-containing protein [Rathayibacter sp. VKM Ac-2856]